MSRCKQLLHWHISYVKKSLEAQNFWTISPTIYQYGFSLENSLTSVENFDMFLDDVLIYLIIYYSAFHVHYFSCQQLRVYQLQIRWPCRCTTTTSQIQLSTRTEKTQEYSHNIWLVYSRTTPTTVHITITHSGTGGLYANVT